MNKLRTVTGTGLAGIIPASVCVPTRKALAFTPPAATDGTAARLARLRSGRAAVLAYFAVLGLAEGLWVARIPGVKAQLHLTDGVLGASLLVGPAGWSS